MRRQRQWPTTQATLLGQLRHPDDEGAWRSFVDLYAPLIYQYSRRRGLQDADAQNVTQEVLALVSRAIRSFEYDPDRGKFRNWLGLITHQRVSRHRASESSLVCGLGDGIIDGNNIPFEVDGTWIEIFNAHVYECARSHVRREVDNDSWRAFEEVWENNQRPADVATQLQRTAEWVYQAKFKVLQRMKEEVSRLGADGILFGRSS